MRLRTALLGSALAAAALFAFVGLRFTAVATTSALPVHVLGGPQNNELGGNVLISDQYNNRVVEVDPSNHVITWHFGDGSYIPGPTSVVGPNDAERVNGGMTLISGTGVPPAMPPFEPACTNGCPDNRVLLVDSSGNLAWQYGQAGVTGSGPDQLNTPVCSVMLPNGDVLITDQGNERVIEVIPKTKSIVWQYGKTGVVGRGGDELNNPNSAELLANGDILIADENNNRVIEVDRARKIIWQYGDPNDPTTLSGAAFASRLPNGNTLITDSNNNRILEVAPDKSVVWTFYTNARPHSRKNPLPTRAVRLRNGLTLISDQYNDQVIAVRQKLPMGGGIVFEQGKINRHGPGPDRLNGPYDAKVIGDFTGLTSPPGQ